MIFSWDFSHWNCSTETTNNKHSNHCSVVCVITSKQFSVRFFFFFLSFFVVWYQFMIKFQCVHWLDYEWMVWLLLHLFFFFEGMSERYRGALRKNVNIIDLFVLPTKNNSNKNETEGCGCQQKNSNRSILEWIDVWYWWKWYTFFLVEKSFNISIHL